MDTDDASRVTIDGVCPCVLLNCVVVVGHIWRTLDI